MTGESGRAAGDDASLRHRLAFLRSPGWLAAIAGVLIFAALCYTVLAPWQFSRHHARDAQNAAIAAAVDAPAAAPDARLPIGSTGVEADQVWQRVTATGEFLPQQVAVRLRQDSAGQPASEILAALRLPDGSILLTDRGYLSLAALAGGAAPPALPTGVVTVTGRLQPFQPDPRQRPAQVEGGRTDVYGIDAGSIPGLPGPVRPGFIQLVAESAAVLTPIGVPQMDPGPFLSYAWQWLAFGTMALLGLLFFGYREFNDPRDDAGSGPGTSREQRRARARAGLYDAP